MCFLNKQYLKHGKYIPTYVKEFYFGFLYIL